MWTVCASCISKSRLSMIPTSFFSSTLSKATAITLSKPKVLFSTDTKISDTPSEPHFVHRLLGFWFDGMTPGQLPEVKHQRLWFGRSDAADAIIRFNFERDLHAYLQEKSKGIRDGPYTRLEREPFGLLALNILVGELPHRMFRDTPESCFWVDDATVLSWMAIGNDMDHEVGEIERTFFITPQVHAERERSIVSAQLLVRDRLSNAPRWAKPWWAHYLQFVEKHHDVLRRFKRYPDRNLFLERENTEEEMQFLTDTQEDIPWKSQQKPYSSMIAHIDDKFTEQLLKR